MKLSIFNRNTTENSEIDAQSAAAASELIFISYAREDKLFAVKLAELLNNRERNVWFDSKIPHTAQFKEVIDDKISEATTLIFLISPHSTAPDSFCGIELRIAANHGKRIVPVQLKEVDYRSLDTGLAKIQWIDSREKSIDECVDDIVNALDSDLDYLKHHTYITLRQVEWAKSSLDSNLLLKGVQLENAEQWLKNAPSDIHPQPTQTQIDYIKDSRNAIEKRKKATWVAAALVLVAVTGVLLLVKTLSDNRKISSAKTLAKKADSYIDIDPEMSLALAYKAAELASTKETEEALRQALIKAPGRVILKGHAGEINDSEFSPDGSLVITGSVDRTARVWDSNTGELKYTLPESGEVKRVHFDPKDNDRVLVLSRENNVKLWDAKNGNIIVNLREAGCPASYGEFSPDGNFMILANDRDVCVWKKDAAGYTKAYTLRLSSEKETSLKIDISPNNDYIATADNTNVFKIWNLPDGKPLQSRSSLSPVIADIAFSPKGNLLLIGGGDDSTEIWDTKTWTKDDSIPNKGGVSRESFSSDATRLVIPENKNLAVIYEPVGRFALTNDKARAAKDWDDNYNVLEGHRDIINRAFFDPNDDVITINADNSIGVWYSDNNCARRSITNSIVKLRGHTKEIKGIGFDKKSNRIVSYGLDDTARIWNISGNDKFQKRLGIDDVSAQGLSSINFSSDKKYVVMGDRLGGATVWNLSSSESGHSPRVFPGDPNSARINNAVLSPDNNWILAATDGTAKIYEWKNERLTVETSIRPLREFDVGKQYEDLYGDPVKRRGELYSQRRFEEALAIGMPESARGRPNVRDAKFSPDGKKVVTASPFALQLWDVEQNGPPQNLNGAEGSSIVLFHPDGRIIADVSKSARLKTGSILIFEAQTGKLIKEMPGHRSLLTDMKLSPDGNFLATAGRDGTARVWDLHEYTQVAEVQNFDISVESDAYKLSVKNGSFEHAITKVTFSPDGNYIATGCEDSSAKIWEAKTGRLISTLSGHRQGVKDIEFSNDGKFVITASEDTTAKLWDRETGQLLISFDDSKKALLNAVFTPDDKSIITTGYDDFARIYPKEAFATFDELKKIAGERPLLSSDDKEYLENINE